MSHVIILAGSVQEANAYRREADLPKGRAIHATSAAQIDGVVPSQVHTLPGFAKRRDQHALLAALKRAARRYQSIKWVEIDERGILSPRDLEVAYRYDRLREDAPDEVAALDDLEAQHPDTLLPLEDALGEAYPPSAPAAEKPQVRRRSRCKDCGALHFADDACPPTVEKVDDFSFGGE